MFKIQGVSSAFFCDFGTYACPHTPLDGALGAQVRLTNPPISVHFPTLLYNFHLANAFLKSYTCSF